MITEQEVTDEQWGNQKICVISVKQCLLFFSYIISDSAKNVEVIHSQI